MNKTRDFLFLLVCFLAPLGCVPLFFLGLGTVFVVVIPSFLGLTWWNCRRGSSTVVWVGGHVAMLVSSVVGEFVSFYLYFMLIDRSIDSIVDIFFNAGLFFGDLTFIVWILLAIGFAVAQVVLLCVGGVVRRKTYGTLR